MSKWPYTKKWFELTEDLEPGLYVQVFTGEVARIVEVIDYQIRPAHLNHRKDSPRWVIVKPQWGEKMTVGIEQLIVIHKLKKEN